MLGISKVNHAARPVEGRMKVGWRNALWNSGLSGKSQAPKMASLGSLKALKAV
jgi:hypothetical protein